MLSYRPFEKRQKHYLREHGGKSKKGSFKEKTGFARLRSWALIPHIVGVSGLIGDVLKRIRTQWCLRLNEHRFDICRLLVPSSRPPDRHKCQLTVRKTQVS